jgi:hypothetical protein
MKLDSKKVKSLVLTYATLALPLATAAYAMDASPSLKFLTFLSGLLPVIVRQVNPKDPFTMNLVKVAQDTLDKEIKKQSKK